MRRLLSVVCSSFGDPLTEDDGIVYPPLPFSGPLAAELTERLAEATFPGTVGAVSVATEGRVVVGFGNDVGVIRLRS